ncbi:bifunctional diguanylate cyclase/phosphodiesterase [Sphaerochaeta sp. PS]|uniref:bifunctional diguanylate cyclase/phosphodiesterase n=1 Tax=Sphaerochaeta sp. PS TaxID=3076336 RepID=UPI0028A4AC68|nr:bifunctional diguanylate cyclase/phosphodiesterase [Sphaerochaeta sp. PS]MDT4761625.1 bifunctional diguanylate cyclase/phosphodiesterase [Sphaerochaeta sp. PS]
MELIVIELFSLAIVLAIRFGHRNALKTATECIDCRDDGMLLDENICIVYLVLAINIHLHLSNIIQFWSLYAKVTMILHVISIPALVYVWMTGIEKRVLSRKSAKPVILSQKILLWIFVGLSLADIPIGKLYLFSDEALLIGGYGIPLMLGLSISFIVLELVIVLAKRHEITRAPRMLMILSALFLLLSVILFEVFRQPYLFAVSSIFMLLVSYLSWQRKELMMDPVTKVPNYQSSLEAITRLTSSNGKASLLMIDIENFRLINERYGEEKGDEVLRIFALFLRSTLLNGSVYCMGGNRFLLLFPHLSHNELVRIVRVIQVKISEGWKVGDVQVSFHVNIAIVETPLRKNTTAEVVDSLNFTMMEIKEKRRQSIIIFNQKLIDVRQRKLNVLSVLRKAVVHQDMVKVYFQPVVDVESNRPIAAEALMRLQDDQLGMLSPGEFIPLAEQAGLISLFTEIILKKVCSFIVENKERLHLSHISINISSEDLSNSEASQKLLDVLKQSPVDPGKIWFEVTESMVLDANRFVNRSWEAFQKKGIRFMLDDFGTGYSNLESLVTLPFDIVKIDRSVVSNSKNRYELLSLISAMLHRLNKQIVAEGVETQEQLDVVRSAQIHQVQGYFYSKPLDEQQFLAWMDKEFH